MSQLTPGNFSFPFNFDVQVEGPLDSRLTVTLKSDLESLPFKYQGMIAAVTNDGNNSGVYYLDNTITWQKLSSEAAAYKTLNEVFNITALDYDFSLVFNGANEGQLILSGFINHNAQLDLNSYNGPDDAIYTLYTAGHEGGSIDLVNGTLYDAIFMEDDLSNQITIGPGQFVKIWKSQTDGKMHFIMRAI